MAQQVTSDLDLDSTDVPDFERPITIPEVNPGKAPLVISFKFKYRDRIQVAELFDGYLDRARDEAKQQQEKAEARAAAGLEPLPAKTMREFALEQIKRDIEVMNDICTGWGLNRPFDDAQLRKFFTKYPGAGVAIATDYRVSCNEGRLGNSAR